MEAPLVDWNLLFEALVAIIILAFFVERALSLLFEWRHFDGRFSAAGLKEPLAFAISLLVTWRWDFDAVSMVMGEVEPSFLGQVITAAVIAGGSKASIKLFQDIAGVGNMRTNTNVPATHNPAPKPAPVTD
jgi:hypothetical protein